MRIGIENAQRGNPGRDGKRERIEEKAEFLG